jgi:hypothetical protein
MMPAYNFQHRFVPMILNGEKPHTIRRRRKYPTKVGDMLQMYVGQRTKKAFKFAESPVVKIVPIVIQPWHKCIIMQDTSGQMSVTGFSTKNELARLDGFSSVDSFFDFFKRYKQETLEGFDVIWWDPKRLKDLTKHLTPPLIGEIKGAKAELIIYDDLYEVKDEAR